MVIIVTICSWNIQWGGKRWQSIVQSDGKGYYAYLPAIFIYHDLNFGFFEKIEMEYYSVNTYYDYRGTHNHQTIDKYYSGSAIAMLPFFLIAHGLSLVNEMPADGYSKIYPIFVNIAAIFYLFIGLVFLRRILKKFEASDWQTALILVAITFGTNLFYYSFSEPALSHIYSFAFINLFVYYFIKFKDEKRLKWLLLTSASLGMIVLIRPVNILVVAALPFITGNLNDLKQIASFIFKKTKWLIASLVLFFTITFIQNILYKIECGDFFVDSYPGESFYWSHPQLFNILFSYKKGLFLYTPMFFISLAGFIYLFRNNKFRFYSLFIFLLVITYVFSSWWCWYYGGSFSGRPYVEYIFAFALLLLFSIKLLEKKSVLRKIYISMIVLLIAVCQLQTYQYRYYFIHWSNMDKEHYWRVFMRVDLIKKNENPNKDLLNSPQYLQKK